MGRGSNLACINGYFSLLPIRFRVPDDIIYKLQINHTLLTLIIAVFILNFNTTVSNGGKKDSQNRGAAVHSAKFSYHT